MIDHQLDIAPNILGLGALLESDIAAWYGNVSLSSSRRILRLDRSGGLGSGLVDETTAATTPGGATWRPFGSDTIPAGSVLRVYDSRDGLWASNVLNPTSGGIASFGATGWQWIQWGEADGADGAALRQAWNPSLDPSSGVDSRRYIVLEMDRAGTQSANERDAVLLACAVADIIAVGLDVAVAGSPAAPVEVNEVVLLRRAADRTWLDDTVRVNGSGVYTPGSDTEILVSGAKVRMGFTGLTEAREVYLHRRAGVDGGFVHRYSAPSGAWSALAYTSGSANLSTGPATSQATPTHTTDRWTAPADWTRRAETFDGATTVPLYWIEFEAPGVANPAATQSPIYRLRGRTLGETTTSGELWAAARSIRAVHLTLRGPVVGTGAVTVALRDLASGLELRAANLDIPAAVAQGDSLDFILPAPMTIRRPGLYVVSGTRTFADVHLSLED
jgi:hypothetical protein